MNVSEIKSWEELPLFLNVKQTAELMGYGQQTIRELCHAKLIPFIRHGRAFVFPRDSLRQWVLSSAETNVR